MDHPTRESFRPSATRAVEQKVQSVSRPHEDADSAASSVTDSSAIGTWPEDWTRHDSVHSVKQSTPVDPNETYYPHPTNFKLSEHAIDDCRKLNVRETLILVENINP